MHVLSPLLVTMLAFACVPTAQAQPEAWRIIDGTVHDESSQPLAEVTVELRDAGRHRRQTGTDKRAHHRFVNLLGSDPAEQR